MDLKTMIMTNAIGCVGGGVAQYGLNAVVGCVKRTEFCRGLAVQIKAIGVCASMLMMTLIVSRDRTLDPATLTGLSGEAAYVSWRLFPRSD